MSTLQHLKERHKGLLSYGKSWQQSRAKAAEKSILAVTAAIRSKRRSSTASSVVLTVAFLVTLMVYVSRQEVFQVRNCPLAIEEDPERILQRLMSLLHMYSKSVIPILGKDDLRYSVCHVPLVRSRWDKAIQIQSKECKK